MSSHQSKAAIMKFLEDTPARIHVLPASEDSFHVVDINCNCGVELIWKDSDTKGEVWLHKRIQ